MDWEAEKQESGGEVDALELQSSCLTKKRDHKYCQGHFRSLPGQKENVDST